MLFDIGNWLVFFSLQVQKSWGTVRSLGEGWDEASSEHRGVMSNLPN